jgi:hypothetical protein
MRKEQVCFICLSWSNGRLRFTPLPKSSNKVRRGSLYGVLQLNNFLIMGILDCKIDERPAPWIWSCRRKKVHRNDHSYARILQESVYSAYVRKIPFFVLIGYIYDPIYEWEYGVC